MNANELTAAYVLGELEGPELAAFERRLAAEPDLRAEVEATRGTLAQLEALPGHAWPAAEERAVPSDGVEAVAAGGFAPRDPRAGRRGVAARVPPAPRRRRLTLRPALAAAAIVAALVIGGAAGALIFGGDSSSSPAPAPTATVLVLHPLDAPKTSGADLSMPNAETMLLRTHGLPASAPGAYYEVWLMSRARTPRPGRLLPRRRLRRSLGRSSAARLAHRLPLLRRQPPDRRRRPDHSADSVLRGSTAGLS